MSPAIYLGCSGCSFRDWKGVCYPPERPPRQRLAYYCAQFTGPELKVAFYRMPTPKVFETWYDQGPAAYRFAV